MAQLSSTRRQLAPTVGPVCIGSAIRAESTRIGIGETIAMGRIHYAGDVPLIVVDETWIPARRAVTSYTIMSFGKIDVYLGFADPAQPTPAVMIEAEEPSGSVLSADAAEFQISEIPKPTQPAPAAMNEVEDSSEDDFQEEISSQRRSCFVGFVGTESGSANASNVNDSVLDAIDSDTDSLDSKELATSVEIRKFCEEYEEATAESKKSRPNPVR